MPYNIFNRDIENKKFKIIKKYNIEIHVRSIFFKGLLTDRNLKVKKLSKWNKYFNKWFDWVKTKLNLIKLASYLLKIMMFKILS